MSVFAAVLAAVSVISAPGVCAAFDLKSLRNPSEEWIRSPEGRRILDNIVSWQNPNGGWWKGFDYDKPRPDTPKPDARSGFDNGATHTETRALAFGYEITGDEKYRQAFEQAFTFILDAQLPNGGWPQHVPRGNKYGQHITFNDNAMTSVMELLMEIAAGQSPFTFVTPEQRKRAAEALDRGVQCILDCQIVVNGQLTGWCAQHHAETLEPVMARSYELPSISGSEGARIVRLLMRIENPDDRVKRSIHAAAAWFERSKIVGKRVDRPPLPNDPKKRGMALVDDPEGRPLWARFYDIETNRPFFCDRDGVKKWDISEIDQERSTGYAWLGHWGESVATEYKAWLEKHGEMRPAAVEAQAASHTQAATAGRVITVAADGSGDFTTVQAAVDAIPMGSTTFVIVQIAPGRYYERIRIPRGMPPITFRGMGQSPDEVILTYDLHAQSVIPPATQAVGTTGSTSTRIDADDFTAENITFENPSGHLAQAVAVRISSDRVVFRNCRFLGGQDTLYVNGLRAYFSRCYIEGRVDFIFGRGTAVFDRCTIHSKNGGYVTAPSTPEEAEFGLVFLDCRLTGEGAPAYLGRPWRDYGAAAFIRCEMGPHIRPEGFHHWQPHREQTARFVEYGCTGPGADRSRRVPWSRELTPEEAARYTPEVIFAAPTPWLPSP